MTNLWGLREGIIRWGLVALVAFTPFAFGTVEPWSIALMEWGTVTLVLVYALGRLWRRATARPETPRATGVELPVGLFLLFCGLQTLPLPLHWLEAISPGSARLYRAAEFHPSEGMEGEGRPPAGNESHADRLEPRDRRPVSVHPRQTWGRIRLVASFAALFLLVSAWATRRDRVVFLLGALTVVGFLVAVLGLVQFLTWNGKIYWVRRVPSDAAFGPFVNHNHFAGYVEMVIPVAISLAFYLIEIRRRQPGSPGRSVERWGPGATFGRVADDRGRWGKGGLALFAALILVVSLFFSLSRGGILSTLTSGLILFPLLWRRIASRLLARSLAVALPALVALLISWIGADVVQKQLGTYQTVQNEASFRLRLMIWETLVRHLPQYVWVGSGLGTFEESFAPHTPPGSAGRWDKAHNDYLQMAWETGVLGALLFLAGGYIFVRRYWWPALRSRAHPLDVFRLGIAISLMAIALHSLVDFNLQIGANGFLCALLAGLLVALHRAIDANGSERPVLVGAPPGTA